MDEVGPGEALLADRARKPLLCPLHHFAGRLVLEVGHAERRLTRLYNTVVGPNESRIGLLGVLQILVPLAH